MATINYNGMELDEFTSDKPVVFDPPRKMYVTDDSDFKMFIKADVVVYDPRRTTLKVVGVNNSWRHCFSGPTYRRATWLELAKWCTEGKGLVLDSVIERIDTGVMFKVSNDSHYVDDKIKVRKWGDIDWHEPTLDYMEIEATK